MTDKVFYPQPLIPVGNPYPGTKPGAGNKAGADFKSILDSKVNQELKFSAHATHRLQKRNIKLDQAELAQLNEAVTRAEAKGAKEALIVMNKVAMVVSVKNRTVITAVSDAEMRDNVFTNIDSAVIV